MREVNAVVLVVLVIFLDPKELKLTKADPYPRVIPVVLVVQQMIGLSKCYQIAFDFDQHIHRSSKSITIFGTSCS